MYVYKLKESRDKDAIRDIDQHESKLSSKDFLKIDDYMFMYCCPQICWRHLLILKN